SLIDIDFQFFDPAEVDHVALKRLIVQLFQSDAELIKPHALTELVLSQPLVGTTVKTEGKESDPLAFLTVLNMHVHRENASIRALAQYFLDKSKSNGDLHKELSTLFDRGVEPPNVGLVLTERLINMPVEIVPPMYRMLADEIQWALEEDEPYQFSHLIFVSRTYRLTAEDEIGMDVDERPAKKKRKDGRPTLANATGRGGTYSFHPEDECIQRFATYTHDFNFTNSQPREKDSFGLDVAARMFLVPQKRFSDLV
ncbi:hypothetical protein SISSUDRAFT_956255, partial [Sistotremastrum suecicum HHB10207 ss-3]